ncbi:MAG: phage holin family protein [Lentisphaerae bacterium]|nr:phage holin family protein [Lentisphaerota bacterium]
MNMPLIVRWLILSLAVWISAELIPGIDYDRPGSILIASLVLGVLNALVKPLLMLLALPFIVVTLGLFLLVINAALFMFSAWLVPGFYVSGFWAAVAGSLVVSVISWLMGRPPGRRPMNIEIHELDYRNTTKPPPGVGPVIDVDET